MNKEIQDAIKNKQARIDKAISIKEKSISYMNSVNASISKQQGQKWDWELFVQDRDKFIELWREWYLENIEPENNKEEIIPF